MRVVLGSGSQMSPVDGGIEETTVLGDRGVVWEC
jgi:hypothetical protein